MGRVFGYLKATELLASRRPIFQGINHLINADVNGALNFLRKVIGDGFITNLVNSGCLWFQPVRIRDLVHTSAKQFCVQNVTIP